MNLSAIASGVIRQYGEQITISRRGSATTWTAYARPQPLDIARTQRLVAQGDYNMAEGYYTDFVMPAGTDIQEATDQIAFDGWQYRVLAVESPRMQGANVTMHVVAVREKES